MMYDIQYHLHKITTKRRDGVFDGRYRWTHSGIGAKVDGSLGCLRVAILASLAAPEPVRHPATTLRGIPSSAAEFGGGVRRDARSCFDVTEARVWRPRDAFADLKAEAKMVTTRWQDR